MADGSELGCAVAPAPTPHAPQEVTGLEPVSQRAPGREGPGPWLLWELVSVQGSSAPCPAHSSTECRYSTPPSLGRRCPVELSGMRAHTLHCPRGHQQLQVQLDFH